MKKRIKKKTAKRKTTKKIRVRKNPIENTLLKNDLKFKQMQKSFLKQNLDFFEKIIEENGYFNVIAGSAGGDHGVYINFDLERSRKKTPGEMSNIKLLKDLISSIKRYTDDWPPNISDDSEAPDYYSIEFAPIINGGENVRLFIDN